MSPSYLGGAQDWVVDRTEIVIDGGRATNGRTDQVHVDPSNTGACA